MQCLLLLNIYEPIRNSMKIGLLTIHHAYNYGAMLQAYATFKTLHNLGHDVEFIDYDNYTFAAERQVFLSNRSIGNILRNLRTILQLKSLKIKIEKFEDFYQKCRVGNTHYYNSEDWDTSEYDVVLTGSDQTFSLYLTNNPQEMKPFFLEHVKEVKKISYASSMGEKFFKLQPQDNAWLKERFEAFDFLAVREAKSADFIEKLVGKSPMVVLDPTLLLSREEWEKECVLSRYEAEEYIVFYTVLSEPWVIKYVENISAKTGLRVIAIHSRTRYELNAKFQYIEDAGPGEFLSIIKNAKYVITTSFHATSFSIIFQKQFVSLVIGEGNRLRSLLSSAGLTTQAIGENNQYYVPLLEGTIDYSNVVKLMQKEKSDSLDYLKEALK